MSEFFECAPYGLMGDRIHVSEFDHPICQQPHAPALPSLRRIGARKGNQVCFCTAIEYPPPGPARLPGHQRYFQPFLAEAPALPRHRSGGNLQGLCDPLVGPAIRALGVGLEKYASVEQLSGVSPATTYERFELAALLLLGKADDVFLVHSERTPVGLVPMRIPAHFLLLNASVTKY